MSTLILNNPNKVEDILNLIPTRLSSKGFGATANKAAKKPKSRKVCSNTDLDKVTQVLNEFADVLPKKWKILPNEQRETLTKFAYSYLESQDRVTITQLLRNQIKILNFKLQRKFNAAMAFNKAIEKLVHSVLDAIEVNSDYYQQILNEISVELDVELEADTTKIQIKQGEVHEWLRNLSNRAVAKV